MLLTVDVGNSNIKFGLFLPDGDLCCTWRAVTVHNKTADEYAVLLTDYFYENGFTYRDVRAAVMASVVPDLTPTLIELCQRTMHLTPMQIEPGIKTGLRLRIDNPVAVGADRVVNVAAARALYGGPAIVLDCGTATKWEALGSDGDYLGGAIGPGIGLLPEALTATSPDLPRVKIAPPGIMIGKNTREAIESGLFWGSLGMVEGVIRRIKAEIADPHTRVIATGGIAPMLTEHTDLIDVLNPTLTLEGLRILWEMNAGA